MMLIYVLETTVTLVAISGSPFTVTRSGWRLNAWPVRSTADPPCRARGDLGFSAGAGAIWTGICRSG